MSGTQGFCLWILQVLVLLSLLVFFLWLSVRPLDPTYAVVDFSIPLSGGGGGGGGGGVEVSLGIEISNGNREGGVHYDDVNVTLYLDEEMVGATTIPSFYQGHGRTNEWRGSVNGTGDRRFWKGVLKAAAAASNGTAAGLKVGLLTAVRYRIWGWRSRSHGVDVQAGLPVGVDGRIAGEGRKIKLHPTHKRWRLQF